MKAITYKRYGSPDFLHLEEIRKPVPRANEILVKIMAASVNSWDYDLSMGEPFLVRMIGGSIGCLLLKLMLFGPLISRFTGKTLAIMGYKPNRKDLDYLNQLFEEGKVLPVIGNTYTLEELPKALKQLGEGKANGKIVIKICS